MSKERPLRFRMYCFLVGLAILVVAIGLVGLWRIRRMIEMPGESYRGPFVELAAVELEIRDQLREHVHHLATTIGERNVWTAGSLEQTSQYLREVWQKQGYEPHRQEFDCNGQVVENVWVELPGKEGAGVIVIGAHYDTVPDCPGANDNGSGVAALLVLSRLMRTQDTGGRTLRFVAFVNEEPPFFQTEQMGSLVYAKAYRDSKEAIAAMLSLETIGFYSEQPGSQQYPPMFSSFYPDTGNFIGFVGNTRSRELVLRCVGTFRESTKFPSEGVAAPESLPGIGWSDHWSFWQESFPAVMVTDTAPFRYPYYHTPDDTADKIDYERTARVVFGLIHVINALRQ